MLKQLVISYRLAAAVALALLGGCATFSPDGGFDDVARAANERGVAQKVD